MKAHYHTEAVAQHFEQNHICPCCGNREEKLHYQPAANAKVCFDCTFYVAANAVEYHGTFYSPYNEFNSLGN